MRLCYWFYGKRSIGISDQLTATFGQICSLSTDTVLELGKKQNKAVLDKVIPEIGRGNAQITTFFVKISPRCKFTYFVMFTFCVRIHTFFLFPKSRFFQFFRRGPSQPFAGSPGCESRYTRSVCSLLPLMGVVVLLHEGGDLVRVRAGL